MKTVNRTNPVVAFAGGGTGGHLFPMLALAAEMQSRETKPRFHFFATDRAIDRRLIDRAFSGAASLAVQPVQPLPRRVRDWPGFLAAWRASTAMCRDVMRKQPPDVVVGSGGYGSAPAICVARKLGIPTVLLNPDAVPGKANRYLAAKSSIVFVQWRETKQHFGRAVRVEVSGCPVRRAFATVDREAGFKRFGLESGKRVLLVTGASQGAQSINRAVMAALDDIAKRPGWQILHLTGSGDFEAVREAYASRSVPAKVFDFTEHMPEALAAADLIVTRAGASTLAEITAMGRPSVILPYPYHRDRHQYANANVLAEAGAAIVLEDRIDPALNAVQLIKALSPLMGDAEALAVMSRAAAGLGVIDAASRIADAIYKLVGRKPNGERVSSAVLRQPRHWRENHPLDDDGDDAGPSAVDAAA